MHKAIRLALVILLIQIAALFLTTTPIIAPTHDDGRIREEAWHGGLE